MGMSYRGPVAPVEDEEKELAEFYRLREEARQEHLYGPKNPAQRQLWQALEENHLPRGNAPSLVHRQGLEDKPGPIHIPASEMRAFQKYAPMSRQQLDDEWDRAARENRSGDIRDLERVDWMLERLGRYAPPPLPQDPPGQVF
jgi:hypothetical protein